MTEEQIDQRTILLMLKALRLMKWLVFQYALLFLMPFLWDMMNIWSLFFISLYTVLYTIYWSTTDKKQRLDYLYKPYIGYVGCVVLCSIISWAGVGYVITNLLLPLFGMVCFILVKVYKKALRKIANTKFKKLVACGSVILFILILKTISVNWNSRNQGDFTNEKTELLERRNYLISKLVSSPNDVINEMPSGIGEQFQGEWALYSCSMLSASLVNLSRIYPDTKEENVQYIDSLIKIVNSSELRRYDTERWGEDAITSLSSNVSHVSYISHLAWMIGGYKSLVDDTKYDDLYDRLCEAMNRRIINSSAMILETYPGEPIYIPDMMVAIVALNQYSKMHDGKYSSTVREWIRRAKDEWCDKETGLLTSFLDVNGNQLSNAPVKGSYSSLNCSYLTLVDPEFAEEQYSLLKKHFWKDGILSGIKEYHDSTPIFALDIDAGPIIMGLSPSGTAFATGAVTFFEDRVTRMEILRTAEKAGHTISWNEKRHYALANMAIVGEAIMLAMRTNIGY